jgi:hypothetical protein
MLRRATTTWLILVVLLGAVPATASETSDPHDVDRPHDVVSISGYLMYMRWPHTVEYLSHLSLGLRFANDIETAVRTSDFGVTMYVDSSGDAAWDLEFRLRSRDGEFSRLRLLDRRTGRETRREMKIPRGHVLVFSLDKDVLRATHDIRIWAYVTDGTAGGVERVPDAGALVVKWSR